MRWDIYMTKEIFMKIYADNAATTKMSENAIHTMVSLLEDSWGNPSSLYAHGQMAKEVLEKAREDVAAVIGASPDEILFTSGGSEADNQALRSVAIISSAFEHHAILHTLERLKKEGFEVTLLDVHENGLILPEEVEAAIREDTCLVTIMFANNEIGTIQPIREIGRICREKNVLFHTDAVQAVAHVPINVKEDNQRKGGQYRPSLRFCPQIPRPEGGRLPLRKEGNKADKSNRRRSPGARPPRGNRKCSGNRGHGGSPERDEFQDG